jgi:hypothetical protein
VKWDKDEHIEEKIKESLEFIEKNVTIKPNYLATFKVLVQETEKKEKQKYMRETLSFLIILSLILFIETIAFTSAFTIFIIIQVLVGFTIPVSVVLIKMIKTRREESI